MKKLTIFFALLLLASCTTTRPTPTASTRFVCESDARTKHAEPAPSRIR